MLKLMKYEFLRRKTLLFVVLIVLFAMEALTAFGIYKGGNWAGLSIILISVMCIGVPLFVFFDSISTYYSDLKNKHGYMLFLTPNNGYKIIGSKLIIGLFEAIISTVLVVAFMYINYLITRAMYFSTVNEFTIVVSQITTTYNEIFSTFKQIIPAGIISFLLQWFSTILMAILSITISKTLLSNYRYGWVISFAVFIVLNIVLQVIGMAVMAPFGFNNDIMNLSQTPYARDSIAIIAQDIKAVVWKGLLITTVFETITIGIFFFVSGRLLNKRIDL